MKFIIDFFYKTISSVATDYKIAVKRGFLWSLNKKYFELMTFFAKMGANVNQDDLNEDDSSDRTSLQWAARHGHTEVVKLLLNMGADVNKADFVDNTPLQWAASGGYTEIVRLLLNKGAGVDKGDIFEKTPLQWAAERGHIEIVKLLLNNGADVNQDDIFGLTPLHWAAACGRTKIVEALIESGAYVNQVDVNERTPLDIFIKKKWKGIIVLAFSKDGSLLSQCRAEDSKYREMSIIQEAIKMIDKERGALDKRPHTRVDGLAHTGPYISSFLSFTVTLDPRNMLNNFLSKLSQNKNKMRIS